MDDKIAKFVALVEAGSYTKAARELRLSQPALTIAVAKLEEELGTTLVVKGERPLRFTATGKLVYEAGLKQKVAMESLVTDLKLAVHQKPEVRLGVVDSVAAMVLSDPDAFDNFSNRVNLSLTVNNSRYLQDLVAERKVDCAVVVERYASHPFTSNHLGTEAMVLVASPECAPVVEQDMQKHRISRFISYDEPSLTARTIRNNLHDRGVEVETLVAATIPDLMLNLVLRGKGAAVLPYLLVKPYLDSGKLVAPEQGGKAVIVPRNFSVLSLGGKLLSDQLTGFIDQIAAIMHAYYNECTARYNQN